MNKEVKKHFQDKYPGGRVHLTTDSLDVFDAKGRHVVSASKGGCGTWQDNHVACDTEHVFDLSPLVESERRDKHTVDGRVRSKVEADAVDASLTLTKSVDDTSSSKGKKA